AHPSTIENRRNTHVLIIDDLRPEVVDTPCPAGLSAPYVRSPGIVEVATAHLSMVPRAETEVPFGPTRLDYRRLGPYRGRTPRTFFALAPGARDPASFVALLMEDIEAASFGLPPADQCVADDDCIVWF
ncbi:MAG: hypothetical protein ACR2MO_03125, partial [Acidimicrobiales bacterium]